MELYAQGAVKQFLSSGERTPERLDELLAKYAKQFGVTVVEYTREQAFATVDLKP